MDIAMLGSDLAKTRFAVEFGSMTDAEVSFFIPTFPCAEIIV